MIAELIKAVFFGLVEGVTEWLPISSTGHMILLQEFIHMQVSADFWDVFLVVIQLGAILAVVGRYFTELNPFSRLKTSLQRVETWHTWAKIVVGTIPAGVVGLLLNDWAEKNLMNALVVALALIVYGVIFLLIERRNRSRMEEASHGRHSHGAVARRAAVEARRLEATGELPPVELGEIIDEDEHDLSRVTASVQTMEQLPYWKAFLIGCFQSLAVVPGTSRSGAIIIGSMLLGTSRSIATRFAFFLAIPVMLGWSIVKIAKHGLVFTGTEWAILAVGCIVAFVVSWLIIGFLVDYVRRHDFRVFGWYRIILGLIVIVYFAVTGSLLAPAA